MKSICLIPFVLVAQACGSTGSHPAADGSTAADAVGQSDAEDGPPDRTCPVTFVAADLWGGPREDQATAVAVDGSGGVVVGGVFRDWADFGHGVQHAGGGLDGFVMRRKPDGALDWVRTVEGPEDAHVNAVALAPDGAVVVAGDFIGVATIGQHTVVSAGNSDAFVAKLGSDGEPAWLVRFGGQYQDAAFGVTIDAGGDVYVTGQFYGAVEFGQTTLASRGYLDVFVARLNGSNGDVAWATSGGGSSYDVGRGIAVDDKGHVFVTGQIGPPAGDVVFGTQPLGASPGGESDVLFAVYAAADGTLMLLRALGGAMNDVGYAVRTDGQGAVFLAGTYWGQPDFGGGPMTWAAATGGFVAKLTSSGDFVWAQLLGGSMTATAIRALDLAPNGDVLFVGLADSPWSIGQDGSPHETMGKFDMVVGRLAPDGRVVTAATLGGPQEDVALGVAAAGTTDVLVAGSITDWMDACEAAPRVTAGQNDVTLLRLRLEPSSGPPLDVPDAGSPARPINCVPPLVTIPDPLPAVKGLPEFSASAPVAAAPTWPAVYAIPLDVNGDGHEDMVLLDFVGPNDTSAPYGGDVRVLVNDGSGGLAEAPLALMGAPVVDAPRRFVLFDFDHDGRLDAFFPGAGWDGRFPQPGARGVLLVQDGTGRLVDRSADALPSGTELVQSLYSVYNHAIAAGDVDCDGFPDVVEFSFNRMTSFIYVRLLHNDGAGHLVPDRSAIPQVALDWYVPGGAQATGAALCDVNRDGAPDLIFGTGQALTSRHQVLLLNDGSGRFSDAGPAALPATHYPQGAPYDYVCADFDLDGWPDIALVEFDLAHRADPGGGYYVSLWRNNGDATFTDVTTSHLPPMAQTGGQFLFVADFNGDGWPDFMNMNNDMPCTGTTLYVNSGDGVFATMSLGNTTCETVVPFDANGDGRPDLLMYNPAPWGPDSRVLLNTTP